MKSILKLTAAAAALVGASLVASGPARAEFSFGFSFGIPGAVGFDVDSGGYCDRWGCPDGYWDYPVFYGPVYYDGAWFQGPVYYRDYGGARWYWVHGGWRRDEWRGPRPKWWRGNYRIGPALGYEYYRGHGFRHYHDRFWRGDDWRAGRDWDRHWWDNHHHEWDHRDHVWDRDHDRDHHDGDDHGKGGGMMGGGDHHDHDGGDHDKGGSGSSGGSMTSPGGSAGGAMTGPSGGTKHGSSGGASSSGTTAPASSSGTATGSGGSSGTPKHGGSGSGSTTGSGSGTDSSGDKPKHKHHDDQTPPGGGN